MINAQERDEILVGQRNFYVYGMIEYTDSLNAQHRHRYCYRLLFNEGPNSVIAAPDGPDSYWEHT